MSKTKTTKAEKELYDWTEAIAIAVVLAVLIRIFIFEFAFVEQTSMYPTLVENDKLCVIKISYYFSSPQRGDIVIVKLSESKSLVKRVIALGGETIEIKDDNVYIDGVLLEEDYLVAELEYENFEPVTVDEGCYFVMGDNRPVSQDSREIGCIEEDSITGRVILRISPFTLFID